VVRMKSLFFKKSRQVNHNAVQNISNDLSENVQRVKDEFQYCSDLTIREVELGKSVKKKVALISMSGISDQDKINTGIINPFLEKWGSRELEHLEDSTLLQDLKKNTFDIQQIQSQKEWNEVMLALLNGDAALFIDGLSEVLLLDTKGGQYRSIAESTTQTIIRGPKDSFTESLASNMSLIRNRIRNSLLKMEMKKVGDVSHTNIAIVYMEGIVDEEILETVKQRIDNIKINNIAESMYIESLIESHPYSPFPTVLDTERPDVVAVNLLEGRLGIIVDGTPSVLILPITLPLFFQSPDDYYQRYLVGSFLRILRFMSFFLALLVPAFFLALITHHQAMIPTPLIISIAAQREGVPFPAVVELLLMEMAFEIFREASVRTPRIIGPTVSIVGALVLGQAVVQAGFVSTSMIIIVSITAVSSFTLPYYSFSASIRLLRFLFIISAAVAGLYGMALLLLFLLIHMNSISSFGVPYLTPISPFNKKEQEDTFIRLPWNLLRNSMNPPTSQPEKTTYQPMNGDET
jgi:spore germination protein KA